MSVEYYGTHIAAMTAAAKHHQAGRVAEMIPRSRAGSTIYCVRVSESIGAPVESMRKPVKSPP